MKILMFIDNYYSKGGIEKVINNITSGLNSLFKFDIICNCTIENDNLTYLKEQGINLFVLQSKFVANPIKRHLKGYKLFKKWIKKYGKNYDIIHFHLCNAVSFKYVKYANKYTKAKLIVHSHNSQADSFLNRVGHKIIKRFSNLKANCYISCSEKSSFWLFKKKQLSDNYYLLYNSIDTKKFIFSQNLRDQARSKYSITNEKIIINVGKFCPAKNQFYTINLFNQMLKLQSNLRLFFVGGYMDKTYYNLCTNEISKLNLNKYINIITSDNMNEIYSMADLFIMPSSFEGFSLASCEAQINGLPCIFSTNLGTEAAFNNNYLFIDLSQSYDKTSKEIINFSHKTARKALSDKTISSYDNSFYCNKIKEIYNKLLID